MGSLKPAELVACTVLPVSSSTTSLVSATACWESIDGYVCGSITFVFLLRSHKAVMVVVPPNAIPAANIDIGFHDDWAFASSNFGRAAGCSDRADEEKALAGHTVYHSEKQRSIGGVRVIVGNDSTNRMTKYSPFSSYDGISPLSMRPASSSGLKPHSSFCSMSNNDENRLKSEVSHG